MVACSRRKRKKGATLDIAHRDDAFVPDPVQSACLRRTDSKACCQDKQQTRCLHDRIPALHAPFTGTAPSFLIRNLELPVTLVALAEHMLAALVPVGRIRFDTRLPAFPVVFGRRFLRRDLAAERGLRCFPFGCGAVRHLVERLRDERAELLDLIGAEPRDRRVLHEIHVDRMRETHEAHQRDEREEMQDLHARVFYFAGPDSACCGEAEDGLLTVRRIGMSAGDTARP